MRKRTRASLWRVVLVLIASCLGHPALAAEATIRVSDVWSRQTVPGQNTGAVYMTITANAPVRLSGATTSAAEKVELHHTRMQDGIMRMNAVDAIDVTPGSPARLAPGGYHIMLMSLKKPLSAGDRIPLELQFDGAGGRQTIKVVSTVRPLSGAPEHGKAHHKP